MKPKVSVIIPTYNNIDFLSEAINSVINQTYLNIELLIIDDGSTDGTYKKFDKKSSPYEIHYIKHAGAGAARNYGVRLANGEYIAFLDADDLWPTNKIEIQINRMLSDQLSMSFTSIDTFLDSTIKDVTLKRNNVLAGICASTLLISRKIFNEIGYFNESYHLGEFIEWFIRAKKITDFKVYDQIIVKRRLHANNSSKKVNILYKDYLKILYNNIMDN